MATKKVKLPKLPKTIYVYEEEDDDQKYLVASYDIHDTCDKDEVRLVGKYELVEYGEVTAVVQYVSPKR